jgi:hypothetical protein
VTMGAGLRPEAKAADKPPDPTVHAPALDPTGGGRLEKYPSGQLADRLPYKKCGSVRADPTARGPEANPQSASVSSDRRAQDEGKPTRWAATSGGNRLLSPGASPRPIPPASPSGRREGARQAVPSSHPGAAGRGRRTPGGGRGPSSARRGPRWSPGRTAPRRRRRQPTATRPRTANHRSASSTTQPASPIAVSWPRSSRRPPVCSGCTPTRRSQAPRKKTPAPVDSRGRFPDIYSGAPNDVRSGGK